MAWLEVGRYRCYRRSVREGGRVRTLSFGSGAEAELACALDRERQRRRRAERDARRRGREACEAASLPLARLVGVTDLLASAALHAGNFYQHHHGDWRRRGRRP